MKDSIEKLLDQYEQYKLSEVIDYDKFNSYAIVHHSSTIEGSTLTEVETRLLLDENMTPKGKPLEHSLMTKDHYLALQFVIGSAKEKRSISPEFIQQINAHVMKSTGGIYNTALGTIDASKGMFRKGNVSAGGSYFVNYDKVEGLVKDLSQAVNKLLDKSKTKIDKLETSFGAHFNLVTIHPFYDGNGRTSRLLMNYIQKVSDLPMSIVYKEDKADYFTALQESRKQNSLDPFKGFMFGQYEKYLKEEITKYQEILPKNDIKNKKGRGYSMIF
jgi:Fic family protein